MRILIACGSPYTFSGSGKVSRIIGAELLKRGHDIFIFSPQNPSFELNTKEGFAIVPRKKDAYGSDILPDYIKNHKIDAVIGYLDSWRTDIHYLYELSTKENIKLVSYVALDHSPASPFLTAPFNEDTTVVAMSKFGQEELKQRGYNAEMVYNPISEEFLNESGNKSEGERDKKGETFDILYVDIPQFRKGINEALLVYKKLYETIEQAKKQKIKGMRKSTNLKYTKEVKFILRGDPTAHGNLQWLMQQYQIPTQNLVIIPDLISEQQMVELYKSADCTLKTAFAEGFGLSLGESQALSIPTISGDFTAMSEINQCIKVPYLKRIPDWHILVSVIENIWNSHLVSYTLTKTALERDFKQEHFKSLLNLYNRYKQQDMIPALTTEEEYVVDSLFGWQFQPDVNELVSGILKIYEDEELRLKLGEKGAEWIKQNLNTEKIINQWEHILL